MGADRRQRHRAAATDCRRQPTRGFTLLEVVVALAIAGMALVVLFQSASAGLLAVDQAGRVDEAIERAQSHLAAFGRVGTIASGDQEGDDGGGYRWRLSAVPLAVQPSAIEGRADLATTLFDIKVTISWQAWGHQRSVVLDTRRFSRATVSQ
jgi:general secretion pathway protein I